MAEIPQDEDEDALVIPEKIDGKKVVGIEDEYFVGGDLDRDDDRALTYSSKDVQRAIEWIESEQFEITSQLARELHNAAKPAGP